MFSTNYASHYQVSTSDIAEILQKMQSRLSAHRETKVQTMLKKAFKDDKEATKYLDLNDRMILYKKSMVVTWDSLCADYEAASTMFIAAENLDLEALTRTSVQLLKYITYVAKHVFDEMPDDLASETETPKSVSKMKESKRSHHKVVKKMKIAKEQSEEDDDGESENDDCESEEDDGSPEESETETPKSISKKKESKWSHHKVFKCRMPGCSMRVGDLKRHLLTHVKKKEIEEHLVPKALAIMKAGKK